MKKRNLNKGLPDGRGEGKSTGQALATLAKAILTPGERIYFQDHFGTVLAAGTQQYEAERMCMLMALQFMVFGKDRQGFWVRFDLYEHGNEGT